ncbi:MAG: LON peptidase substrate-binding domain-containing protein [Nocardioides sp.]
MTATLPMFPLNSVLFPGVTVPLRVFEDRYRAMIHHLLRIQDPAERVFGSVAVREGYEVGDHGAQSLFRIGVRVHLSDVEEQPDGSFEVIGTGMDRIRLDRLETGGLFPIGEVSDMPEPVTSVDPDLLDRARATFTAYRSAVASMRGDPLDGPLPTDPEFLSWTLSASTPLPMPDRQALLEADTVPDRLLMITDLLRSELRAINVIPSLPATEVARTRWSPN